MRVSKINPRGIETRMGQKYAGRLAPTVSFPDLPPTMVPTFLSHGVAELLCNQLSNPPPPPENVRDTCIEIAERISANLSRPRC